MESKQYDLCLTVLSRLRDAGVLDHLVLVGSWCLLLYRHYFEKVGPVYAVRTRDMDFLIPEQKQFRKSVDVPALLSDLGFLKSLRGSDGILILEHPELMIEFLVPERGRGESGVRDIPELSINAQPLRFMDIPSMLSVVLPFGDVLVKAPHPAAFALHKLLVASRRSKAFKKEKDFADALHVLELLGKKDELHVVRDLLARFPKTWQKQIRSSLADYSELRAAISP